MNSDSVAKPLHLHSAISANIGALSKALGEAPYALEFRKEALSGLLASPIPGFKYGAGILLKTGLPSDDFDNYFGFARPGVDASSLKFLAKNPEGLEIIRGTGYSILPAQELFRFSFSNETYFSHLSEAFSSNVIFIRIPEGSVLGNLFFKLDFGHAPLAASIFILAERGSKATLVFEASSGAIGSGAIGLNFKAIAEEGSNLTVVGVQGFGQGVSCFEERAAQAYKDAVVNWVGLSIGSGFHSAGLCADLLESGASSNIRCLYAAKASQKLDLFTSARHEAPHTSSNLITRGVVNGESKALSRGLISIAPNAFGSFGFEKQDALILSGSAEADAIPNLEIENFDVKCSHGSTVGQINKEELFYLMSGGIPEEEAKKLLITGYFNPLLAMFDEDARDELESAIGRAIS